MAVPQFALAHVTRERRPPLPRCWPSEPHGDQLSRQPTAFERILAVCGASTDPEFHDGWAPVRARRDHEQG